MAVPDHEKISQTIWEMTKPFVDDPPYAVNFYNAMGRMVLMFGRLEETLDDWVTIASMVYVGPGNRPREMQTALGRRLELLKRIYRKCEVLTPLYQQVVALTVEIKKDASDRNLVVHSAWKGFRDGKPRVLLMHNIRHHVKPRDGTLMHEGSVTTKEFDVSFDHLGQLISNFHISTSSMKALIVSTSEMGGLK